MTTSLDIEKFNPTKAELISLAEECKSLDIKGIDDKDGYLLVHRQRIKLKNVRVEIAKTGKALRSDALAFQKAVIEKEKELIAIIEPIEIELENKQRAIDEEKEKLKRIKLLPERQAKLKEINTAVVDDFLLVMDDDQFQSFFNQKKTEYLEEKERKIREEQEKIEAEKKRIEEEKRLENVRKEAEAKAKEEAAREAEEAKRIAEEEKQAAIKAEREKAELEKKKIIEEQERKEQEMIAETAKKERESALQLTYTKEQVIIAITQAYYDGMKAGQVEYGDEMFNPEDYLPTNQ